MADSPSDFPGSDDWSDDSEDEFSPMGRLGPGRPEDGMAELLRQLGLPVDHGASLEQMLSQLANQMVSQLKRRPTGGNEFDGATTWRAAREAARRQIANLGPDPAADERQSREIADAMHAVDLWLDDQTAFPGLSLPPLAWSRADWIEQTLPRWQTMIEPVISTIARGLQNAMTERLAQADQVPELTELSSLIQPVLRQAADSMFGHRLGQELGKAAATIVTATDLGLPLTPKAQVAILPTNLAASAQGLGLSGANVLFYQATREAARQRLFSAVAWIGPQLIALVQHYAREIKIDPEALSLAIESAMPQEVTPETVNRFEVEVNTAMFDPGKTDEQVAILERLETLLALVEGWVDHVAGRATAVWMPNAAALAETVRRRRAAGGPAADIFATLLGLSVSPRRLREAETFWGRLLDLGGAAGRDDTWQHPDHLPTAADLLDPAAYLERLRRPQADDAFDAEWRRLLDEAGGQAAG
ncbi:MAG: zinc-dependent metalloprotease [Propionibacteriaceae bacterium]|nr:zinc-dependent metalloprotease [Propionibacteriaceae bacterium]